MKNMQLLPEDEEEGAREAAHWKRLCLQELRGLKKLRRNQKKKEEEEEEKEKRRRRRRRAAPRREDPQQQRQQQEEALDLRSSQAFPGPRDPRLPPRLQGPPPPPLGLFPPGSSSSAPLPHAALYRSRPEAPLSPGSGSSSSRRPPPPPPAPGSEPSPGPPSEMKALQQTRRLLANARERTRVHTISAAFEALRKQVPCYSYGQKLSKLAILRIACNYILSLARLADLDYSADHSNMSFSECVEQCTRTLQAEGRSKKRKE